MSNHCRWNRPSIAVLIAVALAPWAAPSSAEDFDALVGQGRQLEQNDDYQDAAKVFERALELRPGDYALHVALANDYVRLGRLKQAKEQFERARGLNSKEADAYIQEGYADLAAGDTEQAKIDFGALLAAHPTSGISYHHWASYLNGRGDHAGAEASLQKAIDLFRADPHSNPPDMFHSMWNLGMILREDSRLDKAETVFTQGLAESKAYPFYQARFRTELAVLYQREGKPAQAEASYVAAQASCAGAGACDLADRTSLLSSVAKFYAGQGRPAEARRALDQAWELFRKTGRVSPIKNAQAIGDGYGLIREDTKAETVYRFILSFHDSIRGVPELAKSEASLAGICARTGRTPEARKLYADAISVAERAGARDLEREIMGSLAGLSGSR